MIKKILWLIALITFTTSCVSLVEDAPIVKIYRLNIDQAGVLATNDLPGSIAIDELRLSPGLSTERIALTYQKNRIMDYFADAKWNGELEEIIRNFFIDMFENRKPFNHYYIEDEKANKSYVLKIYVKDFQAEYVDSPFTNPPTVNVAINAIILDKDKNKVLREFNLSQRINAKANKMTEITDAFQSALQLILKQLGENIENI